MQVQERYTVYIIQNIGTLEDLSGNLETLIVFPVMLVSNTNSFQVQSY